MARPRAKATPRSKSLLKAHEQSATASKSKKVPPVKQRRISCDHCKASRHKCVSTDPSSSPPGPCVSCLEDHRQCSYGRTEIATKKVFRSYGLLSSLSARLEQLELGLASALRHASPQLVDRALIPTFTDVEVDSYDKSRASHESERVRGCSIAELLPAEDQPPLLVKRKGATFASSARVKAAIERELTSKSNSIEKHLLTATLGSTRAGHALWSHSLEPKLTGNKLKFPSQAILTFNFLNSNPTAAVAPLARLLAPPVPRLRLEVSPSHGSTWGSSSESSRASASHASPVSTISSLWTLPTPTNNIAYEYPTRLALHHGGGKEDGVRVEVQRLPKRQRVAYIYHPNREELKQIRDSRTASRSSFSSSSGRSSPPIPRSSPAAGFAAPLPAEAYAHRSIALPNPLAFGHVMHSWPVHD